MIVCIAEKPSVARDIADILGARERKEGHIEGNGTSRIYSRLEVMESGQPAYDSSTFWHQTDRESYLRETIPYY